MMIYLPLWAAWKVFPDDCWNCPAVKPRIVLAWEYKALPKLGPPGKSEYTPYFPNPAKSKNVKLIYYTYLGYISN